MAAFLAALASSTLADTVYKLALGFLNAYLARTDLADKVRLELADEVNKLALVAATWKAGAAARPDGGGDLHIVPDGGTVPLPRADPDPPGSAC